MDATSSRAGDRQVPLIAQLAHVERSSIWFGGRLPETFYTYGTPSRREPVAGPAGGRTDP